MTFPMHFFGAQWTTSEDCYGPPDTLYRFHVSDPIHVHANLSERVPPIYTVASPVPPFSYCGNSYVDLQGACCIASIRPALTEGYTSAVFLLESSIATFGNEYCTLEPWEGYLSVSVRKGTCHHRMQCLENRTLVVYDKGCSGMGQGVVLSTTPQTIQGSLGFIQTLEGTTPISWTAWVNPIYLVPTYTRLTDYLGLFAILASLICALVPVLEASRVYRTKRTRFTLSWTLSQCFLFLWVIVRIAYIHTVFENSLGLLYMSSTEKLLYNLATLSIALHASQFLLEHLDWPPWKRIGCYIVVGCIHFLFTGYFYFYWFYDPDGVIRPIEQALEEWSKVQQAWIPLLFVFDLCPILYTVTVLSRKSGTWDPILQRLVLAHLINLMGYSFVQYVQRGTLLLRNDRNYFTSVLYQVMMIAIHASLNVWMLKRLREILRSRSRVPRAVPIQSSATDTKILQ
jgi:hypothetical protein